VNSETVSHFLLDCPRHTTLRQQLFFSLLDIPETISLNLLIFGSVNLNDEENKILFICLVLWVCRVPTVFGINSTKYWGVLL
jgi:hypothetical protein